MVEYHKIQTLYDRDPDNNYKTLIGGQWARPEFEVLKDATWVWTEKIDGTNIRVIWDGDTVRFGGRTGRAQIPTPLIEHLTDTFTVGLMRGAMKGPATLYGEGYGPKIQKGGGRYRDTPGFILFDVLVGDVWLERKTVEEIGETLGIPCVPIVGTGTPEEAVEFVRSAPLSEIASDESLVSEGVVMRPEVEFRDRMGRRVISKLKVKDFGGPRCK